MRHSPRSRRVHHPTTYVVPLCRSGLGDSEYAAQRPNRVGRRTLANRSPVPIRVSLPEFVPELLPIGRPSAVQPNPGRRQRPGAPAMPCSPMAPPAAGSGDDAMPAVHRYLCRRADRRSLRRAGGNEFPMWNPSPQASRDGTKRPLRPRNALDPASPSSSGLVKSRRGRPGPSGRTVPCSTRTASANTMSTTGAVTPQMNEDATPSARSRSRASAA